MPGDGALVLPPGARTVLRAPDMVTRALAATEDDPERRWLLSRPRDVRRSFVEHVIDRGATARRSGCCPRTPRCGLPTSPTCWTAATSVLSRKFGDTAADAGSCLPVHGIREHAGGT